MAAEIKLIKSDESPWGFRLTGGRDFGTPLTVLKVGINSVAEKAGLKVGDILVRINNEPGQLLTHREAQDIIKKSGNNIAFSVLRGNLNIPEEVIERLTPLPLQEFVSQTPEPNPQRSNGVGDREIAESRSRSAVDQKIQVIPIKDLDPEQLRELGLKPLPEDFLEKALRDPSPLPEVRPRQTCTTPIPDVLDTLDQLGLQEIVQDIERQKEVEPILPVKPLQAQETGNANQGSELTQAPVSETDGETKSQTESAPQDGTAQNTQASEQPPQQPSIEEYLANQPLTEENFAEIMSGKAEVIDGTNAIGVDFKKFEPQAEFLKKSQVFQTLQEEEQQQQQQDQDQQKNLKNAEKERRWTTFLEKPKRPIPKPKPKPKQTKPGIKAEPTKESEEQTPAPTPEPNQGLYEVPSQDEFEALVKLPEQEAQLKARTEKQEIKPEEGQEQIAEPAEEQIQQLSEDQLLQQQQDLEKQLNPEMTVEEKSDIELQLEEIQKQLEAIRQLPFEIQQHLSMVQDQLTKIVQHRNQEQPDKTPPAPRPSIAEVQEIPQLPKQETRPNETGEETRSEAEKTAEKPEKSARKEAETKVQKRENKDGEEKNEIDVTGDEEEEAILPPPKIEKPKKKKPFMGLGPAPRPIILPGGRKWKTPKDAYNDEFIAETLSAQAEIITGTTLGVNFKKYEPKHVNLEHLRDSIVYKMIHDLEDPDIARRGLADRPEIVPALQDYVQSQATPAAI